VVRLEARISLWCRHPIKYSLRCEDMNPMYLQYVYKYMDKYETADRYSGYVMLCIILCIRSMYTI
jgi:hypothetical protein